MATTQWYRTLKNCIVGGTYRREGSTFAGPSYAKGNLPEHLKRIKTPMQIIDLEEMDDEADEDEEDGADDSGEPQEGPMSTEQIVDTVYTNVRKIKPKTKTQKKTAKKTVKPKAKLKGITKEDLSGEVKNVEDLTSSEIANLTK